MMRIQGTRFHEKRAEDGKCRRINDRSCPSQGKRYLLNTYRSIVAKLSLSKTKDTIFKKAKNLKGKKHLTISELIPQEIVERRKRL